MLNETPLDRNIQWRVRLLDGPILETPTGDQVKRFRSQKVGALLAYLALKLGRPVPREELLEAIWPEENDPSVVSNRFRVALASLRRQMELPGIPFGSVLDVSIPACVCLRSDAVWCDTIAFDIAYKAGQTEMAAKLLGGTLLPGYYEDWAVLERQRLDALAEKLDAFGAPQESDVFKVDIPTRSQFPLPLYLTRYFGRSEEIQKLLGHLRDHRLVTLTGPGGMGKTRIAVEAAHRLPSASIFVALAEVASGEQVPEAILRSLRVSPSVDSDLIDQLIAFFARRETVLLILDNAEHVVEAVAQVALRLLEAIPDLTMLVTTRQRLNIPGEAVLPLSALDKPSLETSYDDLASSPSVALFLDRARNARPDFVLSSKYTADMLEICRLLEGMPFALELAAARVIAQTPAQILAALNTNLTGLKSHQRGLSPRHQSLSASIQGSFDLLSQELKSFFMRLSVFQGGWGIDAAQFVTECSHTDRLLEELVLRSLVTTREDNDSGTIRYYFLEAIRQFAAEQLTEDEASQVAQRHAEHFLTLASQVSEDNIHSLEPLDADQENLLLALTTGGTENFADGLSGALTYAHVRGKHRVFFPWAEKALSLADQLAEIRTRVRLGCACYYLFSYTGRYDLVRENGLRLLKDGKDHDYSPAIIHGKLILAYESSVVTGGEKGTLLAQEALEMARSEKDPMLLWRALRIRAWTLYLVAREEPNESQRMALFRESEATSRECIAILPDTSSHLTFEILTLAYVLNCQGKVDEFYAGLKHGQRVAVEHGMFSMLLFAFREECRLAILREQFEYAAVFHGAFLQMQEITGYNSFDSRGLVSSEGEDLSGRIGKTRYDQFASLGSRLTPAQLVAMSLNAHPDFSAFESFA